MMNMDGSWELARYILSSDSLLRNDDANTFLGSNKVAILSKCNHCFNVVWTVVEFESTNYLGK